MEDFAESLGWKIFLHTTNNNSERKRSLMIDIEIMLVIEWGFYRGWSLFSGVERFPRTAYGCHHKQANETR